MHNLFRLIIMAVMGCGFLPVWAQSVAPEIIHESPVTAPVDQPLVLTVELRNVEAMQSVDLYFRFADDERYQSLPMREVSENRYRITLMPQRFSGDVLRYFIRARQYNGDVLVRGGQLFPLSVVFSDAVGLPREVVGQSRAAPVEPSAVRGSEKKKTKTWKWVVGAVAVGVVLALAGGGGDDEGGTATQAGTIRLVDAPAP